MTVLTLLVAWTDVHTDHEAGPPAAAHRAEILGEGLRQTIEPAPITKLRSLMGRNMVLRVAAQVLWIAFITTLIVQSAVIRPLAQTARWMKDLRTGRTTATPDIPSRGL